MQPTVASLTDAIEWLEAQMTALERRLREKGQAADRQKMLDFLGAIRERETAARGVDEATWAAVKWAVERITDAGTVQISRMADGRVNLLGTVALFRALPAGLEPARPEPEDDFAALLE